MISVTDRREFFKTKMHVDAHQTKAVFLLKDNQLCKKIFQNNRNIHRYPGKRAGGIFATTQ
jgi:hypothetical protein